MKMFIHSSFGVLEAKPMSLQNIEESEPEVEDPFNTTGNTPENSAGTKEQTE